MTVSAGPAGGASVLAAAIAAGASAWARTGRAMFLRSCSPKINEFDLDPAMRLPPGVLGQANSTGLANSLQPRRDIDAVAENVAAVDQNVAEIDPHSIEDALRLGQRALRSAIIF